MLERPLPLGHMFDKLRVESVLGRTADHYVYRASHPEFPAELTVTECYPRDLCERFTDGQVVAIPSSAAAFAQRLEAFRFRSQRLQTMRFPEQPRFVQGWEEGGTAYFATLRPDGQTLAEYSRRATLPSDQATEWLCKLLLTLAALHQAGIAHGNPSFDSIVIADNGPVLLEAVSDGTGKYSNQAARDHDLHALATVFFELLTRSHVPNPAARADLHRVLRTVNPRASEALENALVRSLSRDLKARFESAATFASALGLRAAEGNTLILEIETLLPTPRVSPARPIFWVLAALTVIFVVAAPFVINQPYLAFGVPRCEQYPFDANRDYFNPQSPYRIIFAPTDDAAYETMQRVAPQLEAKLGLDVHVMGCLALPLESRNVRRNQISGEAILHAIRNDYPIDLIPPAGSVGIAVTSDDLYIEGKDWRFAWAYRDGSSFAVVSTPRLERRVSQAHFDARLRKILMKQIGLLYYKYPLSNDPKNVMYSSILSLETLDEIKERY